MAPGRSGAPLGLLLAALGPLLGRPMASPALCWALRPFLGISLGPNLGPWAARGSQNRLFMEPAKTVCVVNAFHCFCGLPGGDSWAALGGPGSPPGRSWAAPGALGGSCGPLGVLDFLFGPPWGLLERSGPLWGGSWPAPDASQLSNSPELTGRKSRHIRKST